MSSPAINEEAIAKVEAEITEVKAEIKAVEAEIKAATDKEEKTALRADKKDKVDRLKTLDARLTMLLQQGSVSDSGKFPSAFSFSCSFSCSCSCP